MTETLDEFLARHGDTGIAASVLRMAWALNIPPAEAAEVGEDVAVDYGFGETHVYRG